jgi:hypothetical protein
MAARGCGFQPDFGYSTWDAAILGPFSRLMVG